MKKLFGLLILVTLVLSATACATLTQVDPTTQEIPTTQETMEAIETPSLEEALAILKKDVTASIPGYEKAERGWLSTKYTKVNMHFDDEAVFDHVRAFSDAAYTVKGHTVSKWEFREEIGRVDVDSAAIYCGSSAEGFVFKKGGGEVLIVKHNMEIVTVTDVKYVISTNYPYCDDYCLQPLFLMEDGSLKVYVANKLMDLKEEGGYKEYYISY